MTVTFDAPVRASDFAGRRVTIVGLGEGRTAAGLARFLVDQGARVTISDAKPREQLGGGIARLGDIPVELVLGPSGDDQALADPDYVFVIPGVRPRSATILRARQREIPVLTEMGVFLRLCPAETVGVTGTKGKSTTTTLISRILARGKRRVITGGNIGNAVIQELPQLTRDDIVVLELSSFQLETLALSPHVAVVTNVTEDHLDHHGTREAYVAAKSNIVRWQGSRDIAVLNLDDPATVALHTGADSEQRGYSLRMRPRRGAYLDAEARLVLSEGARVVCAASELRVPGRHNVSNALAAAVVGDVYGIPAEQIGEVLRAFEGLPHRLEFLGEKGGVWWVNDSQGTTPFATIPAIEAYERKAVVILGGVGKGADFAPLGRTVAERARAVVLMGQAADEIRGAIESAKRARPGSDVQVESAASLADAVAKAHALARPGDVVLLSPASATGAGVPGRADEFRSYQERGEAFKKLFEELPA